MSRKRAGRAIMRRRARTRAELWRSVERLRPSDESGLSRWVEAMLGLRVPGQAIVRGNSAPLAYLSASFFESGEDLVVWASRGGGKTMLAAAATLLDLLFKPGVQVRVLGGSLEQSTRMYRYLRALMERPALNGLLAEDPTQRRLGLSNGSAVEVLAQSQRSVRGLRVHKLRCDEVEEFDPEVWEAAQLVTRSGRCGAVEVRGTVEALSTMHRAYGLMAGIVGEGTEGRATGDRSTQPTSPAPHGWGHPSGGHASEKESGVEAPGLSGGGRGRRVLRWSAMDVIERCPVERACASCVLWVDCQGRARRADGFVRIDDLVSQRARCSDQTWASEMLCQRPSVRSSVFSGFRPTCGEGHVIGEEADASSAGGTPPHRGVPRSGGHSRGDGGGPTMGGESGAEAPGLAGAGMTWIAGMDFGLRATVVLWAVVVERTGAAMEDRVVRVMEEYVSQEGTTTAANLEAMARIERERSIGPVKWIGVDPAGNARNGQSGRSDVQLLRKAGYRVRSRASSVREGVEIVRRRLDRRTLLIGSRCRRLIRSLVEYHFDPLRPDREEPVKDGSDHACDALRYMLVNLERGGGELRMR